MRSNHSSQLKKLKEFRLLTASVILGNRGYTKQIQNHPFCDAELFELCDQYSICICLNWIATRFGFPVCHNAINQASVNNRLPLLSHPALTDLYPLNIPDNWQALSEQDEKRLLSFLDKNFEPDSFLPGSLYQHVLSHPYQRGTDDRIDISKGEDSRLSGEFYTPEDIVRYCLERVFPADSAELMKRLAGNGNDRNGNVERKQPQIKIMDPACGTGNFLLGTVKWLKERCLDENGVFSLICNCLFGQDIDTRATHICRIVLVLQASDWLASVATEKGTTVLVQKTTLLVENLTSHILTTNTVLNCARDHSASSYDIVIGNPPYVSFGSRNQQNLPVQWQKALRSWFPDSTEYKIRMYCIFQDIALRLVRSGGSVCLLVPDAFLNGAYYRKLRQLILRISHIVSLSELPSKAVPGAVVGNWCVICLQKRSTESADERGQDPGAAKTVDLYRVTSQGTSAYSLDRPTLVSEDKLRFQLVFCDEDADLLRKIRQIPALSNQLRGHTGIRSRTGQRSIISRESRPAPFKPGITTGASVQKYFVQPESSWLNLSPENLFSGGFDEQIVESPKIMMRQTADCIIAAVDEKKLYHLNNVHSFSPLQKSDSDELYYLCGLLNSRVYLHLYRIKSREQGRALAQIDIEMIEAMPLPASSQEQKVYVALAVRKLSSTKLDKQEKQQLIAGIDDLVCELFELPERLRQHVLMSTST
jgi:adenine-specific DNA-methyltransferase